MRLVERGRPSPEGAAFHGHAELDYAHGLHFTETGHHHCAVQFLRAALAHQDRPYGRNRALYQLTLSRSLVQASDADEAAAHAIESLEHVDEVESGRVTRWLKEVTSLLGSVNAASTRDAVDQSDRVPRGERSRGMSEVTYEHHEGATAATRLDTHSEQPTAIESAGFACLSACRVETDRHTALKADRFLAPRCSGAPLVTES
ncbi:hypothetical protein [Streptomyces sp. NPDC051001]|uniref:hypothetical protein n=1 Tax=Streptomyces sp. NPDC051001 TaxID=3155795 RepID=UPI0034281C39